MDKMLPVKFCQLFKCRLEHAHIFKGWQVPLANCYIHVLTTLYEAGFIKVASVETAMNEFWKTGILPFDPNVFPYWMHEPEETTRRPL
jgi:hypothetical protein